MVIKISDFELGDTFECGQCFRWNELFDGSYLGVVGKRVVRAEKTDGGFCFSCDDIDFLTDYFDLNRNYAKLKQKLSSSDKILKDAVSCGGGIRILKQDPWEALVSFIISANNNIPRIKKIIESLCRNFGNSVDFMGDTYYTFPSAEALSELTLSDLDVIKSGFRAKYILDAAQKVACGTVSLEMPFCLPTDEAREYLKQIKGVGYKVADCVLLFAYQKYDVFPKDVWTKRVLNELYGVCEKDFDSFVTQHFGENAGFAQQYLFYSIRS